jgi:hypothetical protein
VAVVEGSFELGVVGLFLGAVERAAVLEEAVLPVLSVGEMRTLRDSIDTSKLIAGIAPSLC